MGRKFTRIKGEDKPQNIIRLPRLGKLRLGIKKIAKQSGKEYPTEVDYFVCPEEVKAKYGPMPKSLPVMLPVEDEEMFLRQYYACYGGNQRLKCQGDGENAAQRDKDGKITDIKCPSPEDCAFGKKNKCAARTDLMVVLPDINCGGIYQLSTGSINSDIDIRSGIEMARHLFNRISWVPMELKREAMKIPDPKTGKMMTHWPVKLHPMATVAETNIIRNDTKRILSRQQQFALPEPVIEGAQSDTPIEIIDDEPEEPKGPPPEPEQGAAQELSGEEKPQGETTENYEFLKAIGGEKKRVGEEAYYVMLGENGYEHANQILDHPTQARIYRELQKIPNAVGLPDGCTENPMSCDHSAWDNKNEVLCGPESLACLFKPKEEGKKGAKKTSAKKTKGK